MALGYILARNTCDWVAINDPAFVFTSPNMDQGISRGTRSHVVPEEVDLALWLEDATTDKMYRIMSNMTTLEYCHNGSYGNFTTIDYDDYKIDKYLSVEDVIPVDDIIYVDRFPTFDFPNVLIADKFDGSSLDTTKWSKVETANCSISIDNKRLKFYMGAITNPEYSYCRSTTSMDGDFSVEITLAVDLSSLTDNTSGAVLNLKFDGSSEECYIKIRKNDIYIYSSFFNNTTYSKFDDSLINVRLVRNDDKLYVYLAQANYGYRLYSVLENVPAVKVEVEIGIDVNSTPAPVVVWYDLFILTDRLSVILPNQSSYTDRFYVESYTPDFSHRYLLTDTGPSYIDSIDSIPLTGSGIQHVYNADIGDYVAGFDGSGIITSDVYIDLGNSFSMSMFVTSSGHLCSGESEYFGECQSIVNVVANDNNYISVGLTATNTLYYKLKSGSTFRSDTGVTVSGTHLDHIGITVDSEKGIKFYVNGDLVSSLSESVGVVASGTLSLGNVDRGVGSKFYGTISDLVIVTNHVLPPQDMHRLYTNQPLVSYTPAIYGIAADNFNLESGQSIYYAFPEYKLDLYVSSSLHLIVQFGEAYNCYLTAWDDVTHSTTTNVVFTKQLLKLSAAVYRTTTTSNGFPGCNVNDLNNSYVVSSIVSDMPIKGDDYVFGPFNIVYYTGITSDIGDIVVFRPRLSEVTKTDFPPGNYDFVLTFHYQYT